MIRSPFQCGAIVFIMTLVVSSFNGEHNLAIGSVRIVAILRSDGGHRLA